jgi:hypothetical protein
MTFVPENALENALVDVASDPAALDAFYRALLDADLFVVGEIENHPFSGSRVTETDETLLLVGEVREGKQYIPVFSSLTRLQAHIVGTRRYVAMKGRAIFENARGQTFKLNPSSEYGKELSADEISHLLNAQLQIH